MQNRYTEAGLSILSEDISKMHTALFTPALLKGGNISIDSDRIVFAPSSILLPNGVIVEETESRGMLFNSNGWRTIFYRFIASNSLGGIQVPLECKEGVYTQEELVDTDDGDNQYATIVAWINKTNSGYELIRPNNDSYPHYKMDFTDYIYNSITGYNLFNTLSGYSPVVTYQGNYGVINISPTSGNTFIQTTDIIVYIPFSVERFGSLIIDRMGKAGAELHISIESVEVGGLKGLSGELECKGSSSTTFTQGVTNILKTIEDESDYTQFIFRPKETAINDNSDRQDLPKNIVFKLLFPVPTGTSGNDGVQSIRSIGFSRFNVPQIIII